MTLQVSAWNGASVTLAGQPFSEEVIDVGSGSLQGSVLNCSGNMCSVRFLADEDCWVNWGLNPTAAGDGASGRKIVADVAEVFGVQNGHRIAVIERL